MFEEIKDMFLNYVEPDDEITPDTRIKSQLRMSSFDLICFADDINTAYGVKLTAEDFRNNRTVGALAEFVKSSIK
ncbi:MAG: acyl carrier protein [Clostridia bacterium]|nr:acyl carrier protein [Clostridia bacterium]